MGTKAVSIPEKDFELLEEFIKRNKEKLLLEIGDINKSTIIRKALYQLISQLDPDLWKQYIGGSQEQ